VPGAFGFARALPPRTAVGRGSRNAGFVSVVAGSRTADPSPSLSSSPARAHQFVCI